MTHGLILVLLQLCNSRHTGMRISNFVVLSVITAPRNVLTPRISKQGAPPLLRGGGSPNTLPAKPF